MQWKHLFRRKSLEILLAEMAGEQRLHRVLGPIALTALGIGSIIGAGIFVMTGRVAAIDAGPAIVVSYSVAALGCALAAFCYAEFAAMAPVAGSAYTYSYTTLGELFAWIIGWDLILEYAMACATVAAAWPKYLNELLHALGLPLIDPRWITDPFTQIPGTEVHGFANLPAAMVMAVITVILVLGIRESATTNAVLVLVKVAVVVFVIIVGLAYINPANWFEIPVAEPDPGTDQAAKWGMLGMLGAHRWLDPLDDAVRSSFFPFGVSGVMVGAAIVFFAYIGFDSISTHAEEAIHPQRDVPFGILASLVICTLLYIGVSAVLTGMVPYPEIDRDAAVAAAFRQRSKIAPNPLLRWTNGLVAAGGVAGMTSVLLVTFLSQVRIFLAMARDGLLPPIFGEVHARFRTPHLATMLTGALICLTTAFTPIHILEEMVNIGTLLAFVIVCASVLVLRIQRPDAERPFRCPAVWILAPAGVAVNLLMMLFLAPHTWARLAVWLGLGMLIYFFYGSRHSVLGTRLLREIQQQGVGPTDAPLSTNGPRPRT
jgi:APA family basic amino acid/polyamine antiporter